MKREMVFLPLCQRGTEGDLILQRYRPQLKHNVRNPRSNMTEDARTGTI